MGGSSSDTQQQTYTNMGPWGVQAPYLSDAFSQAQSTYDKNMAQGPYSGDYLASTNPMQYNAANTAYSAATGADQNAVNTQLDASGNMIPAGSAATTGAIGGLSTFAGTNPTQANIDNAKSYASGFDVPGQVQAAMLGANQEAADNTLPSLYRGAAASGNINSDRTAVAQGVVQRGLDQQAAGLTAQLNNSNYQTGLGLSSQGNAQNLQALGQLGSLGANTTAQGMAGLSTGINNQGAVSNQAESAGNTVQSLDQNAITNTMDKYNGDQNFGWNQLDNYKNVINGSYGQQGTTTSNSQTQNNPSALSTIGSGIGALGSVGKLFGKG